jgi:hypothetical protein
VVKTPTGRRAGRDVYILTLVISMVANGRAGISLAADCHSEGVLLEYSDIGSCYVDGNRVAVFIAERDY